MIEIKANEMTRGAYVGNTLAVWDRATPDQMCRGMS
ncbi:hypothetical protein SAMN05216276_1008169 [Streptosporangium subroseum]|uniref:Uncharacterized protein n=1 Tax=Streptosporangium subroseum TaxID=106412 RepID=A0A239E1Z4_9ACTN|nr:hypothetical protein SAMN05216276_1008169 [Streptosporangium subroseum]